jgi:hypothetical protein
VDDSGRPLYQSGQLPTRARRGKILECAAAGEHKSDHCAGQVLMKDEGTTHGKEGDEINACFSPGQAAYYGVDQRQ